MPEAAFLTLASSSAQARTTSPDTGATWEDTRVRHRSLHADQWWRRRGLYQNCFKQAGQTVDSASARN
eukprot:5920778-Alexandrium_andersonii.AAC.1